MKGGDGLVPPWVVGGMRSRVVCGSVCCSRSYGLGHLPWLGPLLTVRPHGAHPHRRRLLLSGGFCGAIGGGGLGPLLAHISRLVQGARITMRSVPSLVESLHGVRFLSLARFSAPANLVGGDNPQMLLLSWQLEKSIYLSLFAKISTRPSFAEAYMGHTATVLAHRFCFSGWRVVAPTH